MPFDPSTARPVTAFDPSTAALAPPKRRSYVEELQRAGKLTGRAVAQGIGALPLAAMDAGVAVRNLATGSQYEMPSAMFTRGINDIFGTPETLAEKTTQIGVGALVGGLGPTMTAANKVPATFQTAKQAATDTVRSATLREGRAAGYTVPPTAARPNVGNTIIEGVGGKAATQQVAALRNQNVTNALARKALGLPKNTPLTPETLRAVRTSAGQAYDDIAKSGRIDADDQYVDELAQLTRESDIIAGDFPELSIGAHAKIKTLQDALLKDKFDARSAVELVKSLRGKASDLFQSPNSGPDDIALARASKEAAGIVEDMMVRSLKRSGRGNLAEAFQKARVLIAKAHSVEDALNPGTGNVVATKLSAELRRGRPFTGELRSIAKMGSAFRESMGEVTASPGVANLDIAMGGLAGGVGAAATGNPAMIALAGWPLARYGTRQAILSKPYQSLFAQPKAPAGQFDPSTIGAATTGIGLFGLDPDEER